MKELADHGAMLVLSAWRMGGLGLSETGTRAAERLPRPASCSAFARLAKPFPHPADGPLHATPIEAWLSASFHSPVAFSHDWSQLAPVEECHAVRAIGGGAPDHYVWEVELPPKPNQGAEAASANESRVAYDFGQQVERKSPRRSRLSEAIRCARLDAKLSEGLIAALAEIDESRVRQLETGAVEPHSDELNSLARIFGLTMSQFVEGQAKNAPMTHLFARLVSNGGLTGWRDLAATGAQQTLGEFMRCVQDTAALEALLQRPPPKEAPVPPRELTASGVEPLRGAEELAEWLRAELSLGIEPIESMQDIVTKRLGIQIVWVTPEELDPIIDSASTNSPRTTILVNLVGGPRCWWRTRLTLGHELCHLLCEGESERDHFVLVSSRALKDGNPRWSLFDDYERIQRRAQAFAACLLAPAEGIRRIIGARDPTSEEGVSAIAETFGLGRMAAITRLQHVFRISSKKRAAMETRGASRWAFGEHRDQVRGGIGLRCGAVAELALEAFASGFLSRVQVREYLGLPFTEPLPEHAKLTADQRAPIRSTTDTVRGIAQLYLNETSSSTARVAVAVAPVEGGWRVDTVTRPEGATDEPVPCGHVIVSYDLTVIEDRANESDMQRCAI